MQRVKRIGFAGLPGVVLDMHDIRRLSHFGQAGSLNGLTEPETLGATVNDKIASMVFKELGAKELSQAALKPQESVLMKRAGIAAASVAHVLKFQTDRVAVLGSMTSPMFAKAVEKTRKSLHGLREPDRTFGALTFNFLRGVLDEQNKRETLYSGAYKKVARDLGDALRGIQVPGEREKAQAIIADLGVESLETALSGLGLSAAPKWVTSKVPYQLPGGVNTPVYRPSDPPEYYRPRATTASTTSKAAGPNVGTLYESPIPANPAVNTVPAYGTLKALWEMLVHPVQKTVPSWKATARDTRSVASVVAAAKATANKILVDGTSDNAKRTAAWITYQWGDLIWTWPNAGIDESVWKKYNSILVGDGFAKFPYEKKNSWATFTKARFAYPLNNHIYPRNVGLFSTNSNKEYVGVTSVMFANHAIIAYYAATELTGDQIRENLKSALSSKRSFPWVVGNLLALARWDALYRAGLIGKYEGQSWVPDKSGSELVPQGTEIYADWWVEAGPEKIKLRFDTLPFLTSTYRDGYGIEPTRHAIGWYGRMGFGVGKLWYDLSPDDRAKYKNAIVAVTKSDIPRRPDDLRVAGTEIPPDAAKDRSNWFSVLGSKVTGLMASVLEVMQQGLKFAKDMLCKVFKWLFGATVGGVICSVLSVLLDFLVGQVIGATAGLFALARGIIGFLDYTIKGDVFGAFKALFLGVTQSIFFLMGGPIATLTGMPMLKSEEDRLRKEAQAAGKNPDETVYPSLERLSEALSKDNPFFIITLIIAVIGVALAGAAGPAAVQKAAGEVFLALCPVVGVFMAPMAMRWIEKSRSENEWIQKSKAFTREQVQDAITKICRICCYVVMGVLRMRDAFRIIRDKWAAYVQKKGGTGKAVMSTVGFFAQRLGGELVLFFGALIAAAKTGFKTGSPAMQILSEASSQLFSQLPGVIVAFASEELGVEGEELKEFSNAVNDSFKMLELARQEAKTLLDMYGTQVEQAPPGSGTTGADTRKKPPKKEENRSKALLPVFGVAAGLALGLILFGGSDGA